MPFQPSEMSEATLRRFVDNLSRFSKSTPLSSKPKRAQIQEAVAAVLGWNNYHDAITSIRLKNKSNLLNPDRSPWALPQHFQSARTPQDSIIPLPIAWNEDKKASLAHISTEKFSSLVLLSTTEVNRRAVFKTIWQHNKNKAILVVSGPGSLLYHGAIPGVDPADSVISANQLLINGSSEQIIQIISSHMAQNTGEDTLWTRRALSLLTAVVSVLVHLRDNDNLILDVQDLFKHFEIHAIEDMLNRSDLPSHLSKNLSSYLNSLPGYKKGPSNDTSRRGASVSQEQHGFLTMQIQPAIDAMVSDKTLIPPSMGLPKTCQLSLSDKLVGYVIEATQSAINDWVQRHPGGLLFFDVPPLNEQLWNQILNRHAHWVDNGVSVWIGVSMNEDIPQSVRTRLSGRIEYTLSDSP